MLCPLGHTKGEALLQTRVETRAHSPWPSSLARAPGEQQQGCSCEVQTPCCKFRCSHPLSKTLDQLSQHSSDWMAKLPQHCQWMCPDANHLSPTELLSPYSVLHPSDTRFAATEQPDCTRLDPQHCVADGCPPCAETNPATADCAQV